MKRQIRQVVRCLPVILTIAVMGLIFFFSSQQAEESDDLSIHVTEKIVELLPSTRELPDTEQQSLIKKWNGKVRKGAHFTIFLTLGVFLSVWLLWKKTTWKRALMVIAVCLLYAASDEFHQAFVGGRGPMIKDIWIDFSGSMAGMAAVMIVYGIFIKMNPKNR